MSATIDRRIAGRRRDVREESARRRLRWLLALVVAGSLVGVAAWLVYQSSYLAVREVSIDGQVRSQVDAVLEARQVVHGVPTIRVQAAALEAALLADPWVAAASVTVTWPGSVAVAVLEHEPAAWVAVADAWLLTSSSGVVLEVADRPSTGLPHISVGSAAAAPGETVDAVAIAALEFVIALPEEIAENASISGSAAVLGGHVAGHDVLLGYPTEMAAKARSLSAVLDSSVSDGAEIVLISADRPAVKHQRVIETFVKDLGEGSPPG